jgi:elongation factor P--(R)-beta-lysine ligase
MSDPANTWRPTATREMLAQRAALLARTRRFFADRAVLEVDTPVVVNAPVTDVHIHSAQVRFAEADSAPPSGAARPYFLHTSPEYAMKRLLAAGSGDIFQICHVVRGFERGRLHNAEFTLIEWYRIGFSLVDLMTEVDALVRALLGANSFGRVSEHLTYRDAFLRELHLDPFTASIHELEQAAKPLGFKGSAGTVGAAAPKDDASAPSTVDRGTPDRDELLELLMGALVGPRLGANALTFVHGYPATQAALARLDPTDPRAALRFELYCEGIELANGFHELACATEQRSRFEHDLDERQRAGLPVFAQDEYLLAALESGLPECSGVALGFDRTVMLATGAQSIDDVIPFPTDRA